MSTIKKVLLVLIILGGTGILLLLFLWNRYFSEPYQTRYMDGQSVEEIAFDGSGQAWLSICNEVPGSTDSSGFPVYSADVGTFKDGAFTSHASNLDLSQNCLYNLDVDPQGRPWAIISYPQNIPVVYEGGQWIEHAPDESLLSKEHAIYESLTIDAEGKVWLGTFEAGIVVFDGERWTLYDTSNSGLTSNSVRDIVFDPQGAAWIATDGGISIFDGNTWSSITSSNSSLPTDDIETVAFDQAGGLWVGAFYDLYVQSGENWIPYKLANYTFSATEIAFDGRGRGWVEDTSYPLAHPVIIDGDNVTPYRADFRRAYYGGNMISDQDGRIWLGSSNKRGFTVISPKYSPPGKLLSVTRAFLSTGGISFLILLLIGICLTIALDSYLGSAIGLGVGLAILAFSLFTSSSDATLGPSTSIYFVPGAGITILGLVGGILGKAFGRSKPVAGQLIGVLAGLIPACLLTVCAALFWLLQAR